MSCLPPELDRLLYAELVNTPPTPFYGTEFGPTEQFRRLELEREKWATLALFDDDDEVGAA